IEIIRVPLGEVEFAAAIGVAHGVGAGPGAQELAGSGREGVASDVEGPLRFDVCARKGASEIQAIGLESVEVSHIGEIEIDDGAIVFARSDEDRRITPPKEIVRVVGVKSEGIARGGEI